MLLALIPTLGLIYPIMFGINKDYPGIAGICDDNAHFTAAQPKKHTNGQYETCLYNWLYVNENLINSFSYVSYIYMFITSVIVLLIVSYILIKFIKYEKLKARKCKMNAK
ncbi:hypothetical protein PVBG_06319 [Plasmodium vivax Brazil I]|uniref:Uncharacterized protein n=1 Tax=Plasmodium vivax (strain Brazil I) TaxID=1033975 RepID=A0A0J9SJN9_PLAV1|nr:hypothetical protein PVBG_06319 [Plasmodium vivax Brazil I]